MERLINVSFPHDARVLLTHTKAIATVCILPIIIVTMDTAFILIAGKPKIVPSENMQSIFRYTCVTISKPKEAKGLLTAYFTCGSYLPVILVILSSVVTIVKLTRNRRTVASNNQQTTGNHGNKAVSHVTKMLLGISLMFLVTNGVFVFYITIGNLVYSPSYLLSFKNDVYLFASALYTINYTSNFWVYTMTSRTFRRELIKIFAHYRLLSCLAGKSRVGSELSSTNNTQSSMH